MNDQTNAFEGPVPEVGDEILVPVVPHVGRHSVFPDQIVTLRQSPTHLELVLLRQELVIKAQRGTVLNAEGEDVTIEFTPHQVRPELLDVGHIRLANGPAADMALAVLATLNLSGQLNLTDTMNRLQSMVVEST